MKAESFIKKNVETTVQGIVVVITNECKKGEIPNLYKCDFNGEISPSGEGGETLYFNGNVTLNILERKVQVWSSENVPFGFLGALEQEMLSVHEFVMSETEV